MKTAPGAALSCLAFVFVAGAYGQSNPSSGADSSPTHPVIDTAQQEVDRVRELVEAGALPRKRLEEAESKLDEARDEEILRATLYGQITVQELTEEQSKKMVAASARQWERAKARVAALQELVDEGVKPRVTLTPLLEDLDRARKTHDLATTRSRLFDELAAMVRAEQEAELHAALAEPEPSGVVERFDGDGVFKEPHLQAAMNAFHSEFRRPLPISALGDTAVHRSMGFDHRGRVDVAVTPDSREGAWLRRLLEAMRVPYFAFRGFVPGKATGAHIHIGAPSPRIR